MLKREKDLRMKNKNTLFYGIILFYVLLFNPSLFQVNQSTATTLSTTYINGLISINGNTDFENQAASKGWAGNGSASNPYIIDGYGYNLLSTNAFGIYIQDTTKHFIIQNCGYFYPTANSWSSGAMKFVNVENGRISNNLMYGTPEPYWYSGTTPGVLGIHLEDCVNIEINSFTIYNYAGTTLCHVYHGIFMENSQNVNITNCELPASIPIYVRNSANVEMEGNIMQHSASHSNPNIRHRIGVYLRDSSNCLVIDNVIMNWDTYGVYLYGTSTNNIIVENGFYSSYTGHTNLVVDDSTGENYLTRLLTPERKNLFEGPVTPTPGYYPGSSYNTAGDGFDCEDNGLFENSLWSATGTGMGWASTIVGAKNDSYGKTHKKVLAGFTGTGSSPVFTLDQDTGASHTSGTVEFWLLASDPSMTGSTFFSLKSATDLMVFKILFEGGFFKFTDDGSTITTNTPAEHEKWYRISLDYDTSTSDGSYSSLGAYQYKFRIYDSLGMLLYTSPAADFEYEEDVRYFHLQAQGGPASDFTIYLDALGHYWPDSSGIHGYNVGDNQAEGILMDLALQRVRSPYLRLGFSINNEAYQYITWPGGNYFYEALIDKLVIPIPAKDGSQNVSVFWADAEGEPYTNLFPYIVYFSTYFQTYYSVSEYLENGIAYPPGKMVLADDDDLTISLTYSTQNWYHHESWTKASYSFKVNKGTWMGPYTFQSGLGAQSGNFTIKAGNYSIFDNLYYYITLDQYDDPTYSNHLASYYLTTEPVALNYEQRARIFAFRKKISPIPYELTLNYSVYYQSQINAITSYFDDAGNVVNVTTYPYTDILYQNISLSFSNTTANLDEYSVSCFNESLLNHIMAGETGNISTAIDPIFTYPDAISSPFILPEDMKFTTSTPNSTYVKFLTIPAVSFCYLPGYNLSFTGGLFSLTYTGSEQWPDSQHIVHTFLDSANNVTIRYDSATKIMVYFEYINTTIPNRMQRTTIVLRENNASYPINLKISWYDEIISSGVKIIPHHLLAIVYDPPGDHSFGQISSGTTITKGFSVTKQDSKTFIDEWKTLYFGQGKSTGLTGVISNIAEILTEIPGLGDVLKSAIPGLGLPPGQHEISKSITKGISTDYEFSITYSSTFTSSLNSEDPELIGAGGGDLYYGTGMIIYWTIKHRIRYIDTTTASNSTTDKVRLWNGTNWMEYGLAFNTSFTVLGAYLENYGLENLTKQNPFLNDNFNYANYKYLEEYQTSTMFWTPDYITELEYSTTSSYTESYSFTVDISKSDFYCWNQIITGSASVGLGFVAEVSLGGGLNMYESSGRRGWTYEFSMSTISTTATVENRQTIAHFEDDDGTPIGQHDQFGLHIYRDLRYNTFGYQIIPEFTYTSNPYEYGTLDRRPPIANELIKLNEYIGGNVPLQAMAIDDETGVKSVKIYYDDDPVFNPPDTELLVTLMQDDGESDIYDYLWNTAGLHGTYYLFMVTEDYHANKRISSGYLVQIDNVLPEFCQIASYGLFEGPISLYTTTFDTDSGISYVEYWNGDPTNASSNLLGSSSDASTSYRYIWATDPNGTDDGLHYIFARAYDRAGNFLDSKGLRMEVDTYKERSTSFPSLFTIALMLIVITYFSPKRKKRKN